MKRPLALTAALCAALMVLSGCAEPQQGFNTPPGPQPDAQPTWNTPPGQQFNAPPQS